LEAPLKAAPVPDGEELEPETEPVDATDVVPAEAMVPKGVVEVGMTNVTDLEAEAEPLALPLLEALEEAAVEEPLVDDVEPVAPTEKLPLVA